MPTPRPAIVLVTLAAIVASFSTACADSGTVIMATGTTAYDTGLLEALVPLFEEQTGHRVIEVAVGTGQAIEMGRRGDADLVLAHDPASEERFIDDGLGINRRLLMYNDFVILGPPADTIGVGRAEDAVTAMHAVRKSEATFVSRGDGSGTHERELKLWAELDFDPTGESWYGQTGQGMAATLQIANQRGAYTISDRGTFLALRSVLDLDLVFESDPVLLNVYHVMQVNPDRFDDINANAAAALVEFLVSDDAQERIGGFGVELYGEPLFLPAAGRTVEELRETQ